MLIQSAAIGRQAAGTKSFRNDGWFYSLAAVVILAFAAATPALALEVGLAIQNDMDNNGKIAVVNGSKVKVAFEVDDPDKVSNKKDTIELRRVDDDSVVTSIQRGKKKSGTASLKVKNSEGEQLYVAYVLKGETDPSATTSHPEDEGFIELMSIASMSMEELIISNAATIEALESRPRAIVGDGAPDADDDNDAGYPNGSIWIDMSQNQAYILVDGSDGEALWRHVTDHANTYAIGDTGPAGGIVFYITENGAHGLEAAPEDLASAEWGCFTNEISGADAVTPGSGEQNTAEILAECSTAGIAAALAAAYSLNGYSDWFLPSKDALDELYNNSGTVGGFAGTFYWSSSEFNNLNAWYQDFSDGFVSNANKDASASGRAIRAF